MKSEFSFEQKICIWMHYVATQYNLIHDLMSMDLHKHTKTHFGEDFVPNMKYPVLYPDEFFIPSGFDKKQIMCFDIFCNYIDEWYWRFEKEIIFNQNYGRNQD